MPRSFDRIKPGLVIDRQTAATLNRALELLEAIALPRSTGEVGLYSRPGGIAVSDQRPFPETWWVSIDGPGVTSQRYEDWTRVEDQGDGTFAAAGDDAIGGPTFPGFLPPGWPIPAAGSVAMGIPASDGESLLLLTPPASAGTAPHPVINNVGPFTTVNYLGPSTFVNFTASTVVNFDSTTVVTIASSVSIIGPVCWDHYPLWDAFEDTLHASPVADYAGSVKPWWRLGFDASDPEWEISGLVAPPETCEGAEHVLTNTAPVPLVLLPDDAGSVAANRFETPDGLPFTLATDESVWVRYDRVLSRWRVLYRETRLGVQDSGGTPDYDDVRTLVIDQSTGLLLSQPVAGQAQLILQLADFTHPGVMTTGDQAFNGIKYFRGGAWAMPFTIGAGPTGTYPAANFSFFTDPGSGSLTAGVYLVMGFQESTSGVNCGFRVGQNTFVISGDGTSGNGPGGGPLLPNIVVQAPGGTKYGGYSNGTNTYGLPFWSGLYVGDGSEPFATFNGTVP